MKLESCVLAKRPLNNTATGVGVWADKTPLFDQIRGLLL